MSVDPQGQTAWFSALRWVCEAWPASVRAQQTEEGAFEVTEISIATLANVRRQHTLEAHRCSSPVSGPGRGLQPGLEAKDYPSVQDETDGN